MTEQALLACVNRFAPAGGAFVALAIVPESLIKKALAWMELEQSAMRGELLQLQLLKARADWESTLVRTPVAAKRATAWLQKAG